MVVLNHQNSPITRAERLQLNENWVTIADEFLKVHKILNIVTGGREVDELLTRIENAIESAETSVTDINKLIADVNALIVTTNQTIESANNAAINATNKASEAQQATTETQEATNAALQAIQTIERLVADIQGATMAAEQATQEANDATTLAQQATTEAQAATTAANESSNRADESAQNADNSANNANQVAQNLSGYDKPIEDFSLAKTFLKHQAARFNGSTYRAKVETTGNPLPVDPAVENDWWTLEAKRGTDGEGSVGSVNGKLPDDSGNVEIDVTGGGTWDEIAGKPETFPPSTHQHAIADVEGLQDALDNTASTWDDIEGKPEKFPPSIHGHEVADISGLQGRLDTKASTTQLETHTGNSAIHLSADDKKRINEAFSTLIGGTVLGDITIDKDFPRLRLKTTSGSQRFDIMVNAPNDGVSMALNGIDVLRIYDSKDVQFRNSGGTWSKLTDLASTTSGELKSLLDRFGTTTKPISNCNNALETGIYYVGPDTTNAPKTYVGSLVVIKNVVSPTNDELIIQKYISFGFEYQRIKVGEDWYPWEETSPTKLFQSVSDGKKLVANAITGKGVSTAVNASFATMASNITEIPSGGKQSSRNIQITIPQGATQHNILHDLSFPFPIKDAEIFYRRISLDIYGTIISTGQSVAYSSGNPSANNYDTGGIWYNGTMNGVVLPNMLGSQERTHISGNTLKIRSTIYSQNPLPAQTVEATIRVRG